MAYSEHLKSAALISATQMMASRSSASWTGTQDEVEQTKTKHIKATVELAAQLLEYLELELQNKP